MAAKFANMASKIATWQTWTKCLKSCCFRPKFANFSKIATHTPPAGVVRRTGNQYRSQPVNSNSCRIHGLRHAFQAG